MSEILARLLDIVFPSGGYSVQLVEAYFDESGSHEGSPVLCVAGYIIEKNACIKLDEDWAAVLKQFKLPFFRMSACAHPRKDCFELMSGGKYHALHFGDQQLKSIAGAVMRNEYPRTFAG